MRVCARQGGQTGLTFKPAIRLSAAVELKTEEVKLLLHKAGLLVGELPQRLFGHQQVVALPLAGYPALGHPAWLEGHLGTDHAPASQLQIDLQISAAVASMSSHRHGYVWAPSDGALLGKNSQ